MGYPPSAGSVCLFSYFSEASLDGRSCPPGDYTGLAGLIAVRMRAMGQRRVDAHNYDRTPRSFLFLWFVWLELYSGFVTVVRAIHVGRNHPVVRASVTS